MTSPASPETPVKFNAILDSFGMTQHVESPTHNAGHTLDVVITKVDLSSSVDISVSPPAISDHSLIVAKLPVTKHHPPMFGATVRAWRRIDREAFRRDLALTALSRSTYDDSSVDEIVEDYQAILHELADRYAPCRTIRRKYRPLTPWFNEACRAEKRKTRCLERVYRRTKRDSDRTIWIDRLRSAQKFYQHVQDVYWQTTVSESSGNARRLWNSLSSLMGKGRNSSIQNDLSSQDFMSGFSKKVSDVRASTQGSPPPNFSEFKGVPITKYHTFSLDDVR